jgi:hypothetical protein
MLALLFFLRKMFVSKVYPQKTGKMLDQLPDLNEIGLHRDENGYSGSYRDFPIYIYATTSIKPVGYYEGNKYQAWVIAAPEKDQLGSLGGFFSNYLVSGKKEGYAMIGFLVNFNSSINPAEDIRVNLEKLINILNEKRIKPYVV